MAITVDFSTQPYTIEFKQADLTLVSGTRYQITVDFMWQLLREYSDGSEGMAYPVTYRRIPSTESTPAITEINDPVYQARFENGNYSVDIVNGNTNFRDVEVKNNVSVGTNNTTGFIDPVFLQAALFDGEVTIDQVSGVSGTGTTPSGGIIGTKQTPVNNLQDAKTIANNRGLDTFSIVGTFTFGASDTVDGFVFEGNTPSRSSCVLTSSANIVNCVFRNLTVSGELDGGNDIVSCIVDGINYIDGVLEDCLLTNSDIVLSGTLASFVRCSSVVAGGGVGQTASIDMGGTGTDLIIRDYHGGIELKNHTSGIDDVSIDMSSGRVVLASTITSGEYTIRGVGSVEDNSTGTAVVNVNVLDPKNLNRAAFTDGGVYLEQGSGNSGTTFPTGTPSKAVDNFADAITIANAEGLKKIFMTGFFTLAGTEVLDGITVIGGSGSSNVLGLTAGVSTDQSGFEKLIVYGQLGGLSRISNCVLGVTGLGGFTECEGRVIDCIINSTDGVTQKTTGAGTLFDNCSFIYTNDPQISLDANGKAFSLRACTGNILIENATAVEAQQINMSGGRVEFDATCTAGTFYVDGMVEVTDNSAGATVIDQSDTSKTKEVWQLHGLDASNPMTVTPTTRTSGGISQVISGDGSTTTTITRS